MKAFRDGEVAAEFTGAIPPAQIEALPRRPRPLPRRRARRRRRRGFAARGARARPAPRARRRRSSAACCSRRGEADEALELLEPLAGDFLAEGLVARARLAGANGDGDSSASSARAFAAWDAGDHATALEPLQEAIAAEHDPERRDLIRRVMVGIFTELGADHELAREHRRRLAAALN